MKKKTAMRLRREVPETYDAIADAFDRTRQRTWPGFTYFDDHLPEGARVVDIGCGNGRLLRYLDDKSVQAYLGIDNSKALLKHARRQHPKSERLAFRKGDMLDLPIKDERYDAAFMIASLHHIPSRAFQLKALREAHRVLADDGLLFLSVWDLFQWAALPYFARAAAQSLRTLGDLSWQDLMVPWGRKNPEMRYCYAFRPTELEKLLADAGFEVLEFHRTTKGKFGNHIVVARPFLKSRRVRVMDVPFHAVTLDEAVDVVGQLIRSGEQHYVVTPNPEILLKAEKDETYRMILESASLSIPDGTGILWAARFVNGKDARWKRLAKGGLGLVMTALRPGKLQSILPERVTGTDLMEHVSHQSHQLGAKIFLLGAAPGVAKRVAERWRFDQIVGHYSGSPIQKEADEIVDRVNASGANVLFVAFGAPAQEKWIARYLQKMPGVKVAVGVGGAFDFVAGVQKRAPQWMQDLGLEWLWRVGRQPSRLGRILDATVKFPLKAMWGSLKSK